MAAFTTTHRGCTIEFHEHSEIWSVNEIDVSRFEKLSDAKKAIDDMIKKMRDDARVEAFEIGEGQDGPVVAPTVIVEYIGTTKYEGEKVAAVAVRGSRKSRKEISLESVIANTKENLELLEDAKAAYRALAEARAEYKKRIEAIPRLTKADVPDLVEIYNRQQTPKE